MDHDKNCLKSKSSMITKNHNNNSETKKKLKFKFMNKGIRIPIMKF